MYASTWTILNCWLLVIIQYYVYEEKFWKYLAMNNNPSIIMGLLYLLMWKLSYLYIKCWYVCCLEVLAFFTLFNEPFLQYFKASSKKPDIPAMTDLMWKAVNYLDSSFQGFKGLAADSTKTINIMMGSLKLVNISNHVIQFLFNTYYYNYYSVISTNIYGQLPLSLWKAKNF